MGGREGRLCPPTEREIGSIALGKRGGFNGLMEWELRRVLGGRGGHVEGVCSVLTVYVSVSLIFCVCTRTDCVCVVVWLCGCVCVYRCLCVSICYFVCVCALILLMDVCMSVCFSVCLCVCLLV